MLPMSPWTEAEPVNGFKVAETARSCQIGCGSQNCTVPAAGCLIEGLVDYVNSHRSALRRFLVLLDAVSIFVAMVAAMGVHSLLRTHYAGFRSPPALEAYILIGYVALPLWLSLAAVLGLYRQLERPRRASSLLNALLRLHVFGLLGLALLIYLTQIPLNRSVVGLFVAMTFVFMFANRLVLHTWIRHQYAQGHSQLRVLLVADSRAAVTKVAQQIGDQSFPPMLIGCVAHPDARDDPRDWGLAVLGSTGDLRQVLHESAVDVVLVSCSRDVVLDIDALLEACDEVGVPLQCHLRVDHDTRREVRIVDEIGLPALKFDKRRRSADALIAKRLLDIAAASAGLIMLSPLLLLVTLGVWTTMGRPILFCQLRTGYNGRAFTMYKFRTMVRDAEERKAGLAAMNEVDGPAFKIQSDPRVTPFGKLLRRTSIDELPQLFNVLIGRMSLVGPRPLPIEEQQRIVGPQRRRLSMKPGITGLWQVSGRSDLSFEEWMQLDLAYVDDWSLLLDLQLLLRTIPAVMLGRGAK